MKLPRVTGREVVRALERAGFVFDRQRGAHVILCENSWDSGGKGEEKQGTRGVPNMRISARIDAGLPTGTWG